MQIYEKFKDYFSDNKTAIKIIIALCLIIACVNFWYWREKVMIDDEDSSQVFVLMHMIILYITCIIYKIILYYEFVKNKLEISKKNSRNITL